MAVIVWDEKYSVGVAEIDGQHKGLLQILDDLFKVVLEEPKRALIEDVLNRLEQYADVHFDTEERLMEECDFHALEAHKAEHREFRSRILSLRKDLEKSHEFVYGVLLEYVWEWFRNHLCDVDQQYAPVFAKNGIK